jgi:mannose-6-phosphate isomerase-like protein (cupin superfamily)
MHWSADEIARIFAARLAQQRDGQAQASAPAFRGQSFRTHSIVATFREKYPTPRPSNRAGVVSRVDDADQHEGVTDFYVMVGGTGQMITDGQIQNRVYGHSPRSAFANKAKVTEIYAGEFNGQPVVNGRVHDLKAGDWLAIPPNVPHWPGYEPRDGLMYLNLKINLGFYPPNLMY